VFGEPDGKQRVPLTVRRRFAKALAGAEVRAVRFHDLRHTAASLLVANGVDLLSVSRILGHAGVAMTARYSHLGADHLADAVGRVKLPRSRKPRKRP
jgi:integrase